MIRAPQDAGAFHKELPTAIPPEVVAATASTRALGAPPSIERLSLSGLALVGGPPSPDTTTPTTSRTRAASDAAARARGDLTSPRIANFALRGSPGKPTSGRPLHAPASEKQSVDEAWREKGESDHGPPHLNADLENAEEIDEGFTARESG